MNIAIIHHSADWDGKLSNEVCRYHLKRNHPDAVIHSYGWDYGEKTPKPLFALGENPETRVVSDSFEAYDQVYIVDLSVDELMNDTRLQSKIIWIDHHVSAIKHWDGQQFQFRGYRLDGVAACRLCWQWFAFAAGPHGDPGINSADWSLPNKADYVNRSVEEPLIIRMAGEYDIWDHRDPNVLPLQFGLNGATEEVLKSILLDSFNGVNIEMVATGLVEPGKIIQAYVEKMDRQHALKNAFDMEWRGIQFCALNIGRPGNSQMFKAAIKPHHEACFGWRYTGGKVYVSLYAIPGKEVDLLKIATSCDGGGHAGACGFRMPLEDLDMILQESSHDHV